MRDIVAVVIHAPGPFPPLEKAILERRPDLRGRQLTPWHLIAARLKMSQSAWDALALEERVALVAKAVDEIEPRA